MRAATIVLFLATGCRTLASAAVPSEQSNLLEYGCGFFGERDYQATIPNLGPPDLKLYQDGTLVVRTDEGFEERRISPTHLQELRKRIERIRSERTKGSPEQGRRPLLMHGGLCYVRVGSEERDVIRVFDGIPGGMTGRLLKQIEQIESEAALRFVPEHVTVELEVAPPSRSDLEWPFSDQFDLSSLAAGGAFAIEDLDVLGFLFDRPVGTWRLRQRDNSFLMRLRRAPAWYEPDVIKRKLEAMLAPPPFVEP
jgi:hypothetical protein